MRAILTRTPLLRIACGLASFAGLGAIGCGDRDDDVYVVDDRPDTVVVEDRQPDTVIVERDRRPDTVIVERERPQTVVVERERRPVIVEHQHRPSAIIVHEAPPRPRVERRPRSPGADHLWIEGHWRHDGNKFDWQGGRYERQRPNKHYRQSRWDREGDGWRFEAGGWRDRDD